MTRGLLCVTPVKVELLQASVDPAAPSTKQLPAVPVYCPKTMAGEPDTKLVGPKTVNAEVVGVNVMLDGVADRSVPEKEAVVPENVNGRGPVPVNDQETRDNAETLHELQVRTISPVTVSETIE
jgi:hypothetical protein